MSTGQCSSVPSKSAEDPESSDSAVLGFTNCNWRNSETEAKRHSKARKIKQGSNTCKLRSCQPEQSMSSPSLEILLHGNGRLLERCALACMVACSCVKSYVVAVMS